MTLPPDSAGNPQETPNHEPNTPPLAPQEASQQPPQEAPVDPFAAPPQFAPPQAAPPQYVPPQFAPPAPGGPAFAPQHQTPQYQAPPPAPGVAPFPPQQYQMPQQPYPPQPAPQYVTPQQPAAENPPQPYGGSHRTTPVDAFASPQHLAAQYAPPSSNVAARAMNVTKAYGSGETLIKALDNISVDFAAGEFTAIMGPSGSGKSTLMHCLAGLDNVTEGQVWIGDTPLAGLNDKKMTKLRRERIGFVFQSFNLVPTLTAKENITLPVDISGGKVDKKWFDSVIKTLGLGDRLTHRPSELSGGQQQRVACARALVSRPAIIFGDEPTGNLDTHSSAEVLGILRRSVSELGQTVVIVTHDPRAASYADRVVFLRDGRFVDEVRQPTADIVYERMRRLETV